jgi:hypothetical protein
MISAPETQDRDTVFIHSFSNYSRSLGLEALAKWSRKLAVPLISLSSSTEAGGFQVDQHNLQYLNQISPGLVCEAAGLTFRSPKF